MKDNVVTANVIAPNSITNAAIAESAVNAASIADGSITENLLDSGVTTKLNQAAPTWSTLSGKPTVIAAGADQATAQAVFGTRGYLIATNPAYAGGMHPSKTQAENTAAFQAMMDAAVAGSTKDCFIPAGTYAVFELFKPDNVNLFGEAQRDRDAIPTTGTVLYRSGRLGDGWVLWAEQGIVANLALRGAGAQSGVEPAHHGLFPGKKCRVENVLITRCLKGVEGEGRDGRYGSGQFINLLTQNNRSDGISGLRDSALIQCQSIANRGHGAYFGPGNNDCQWIGGRSDWNNGCGIRFYQSGDNRIRDVVIDRNGKQGVSSSSGVRNRVDALFTRNGRLSAGVDEDGTHLTTANDTECFYSMQTWHSDDDGGGGYDSPKFSVRHAGGTNVHITEGHLSGCTSSTPIVKVSDGDVRIYGNSGLKGVQSLDQHRARWGGTVSPVAVSASGSNTIALTMPELVGTYTDAVDLTLTLKARPTTGARFTAQLPIAYYRNGTNAQISVGAITNRVGDRFALTGGLYLNVGTAVDVAGTTLTVTLTNADAAMAYYISASLAIS